MSSYREKEFIIFRLSSGTSRLQKMLRGGTDCIGYTGNAKTFSSVDGDPLIIRIQYNPGRNIWDEFEVLRHGGNLGHEGNLGHGRRHDCLFNSKKIMRIT
jgi:hypothetical protein